jgi:hypothetical protein
MGHRAERARGSDGPNHKVLLDRVGGALELGCNPSRSRTLQNQTKGVVKASRRREQTLIKNSGPSSSGFYDELTTQLSKKILGYDFLRRRVYF